MLKVVAVGLMIWTSEASTKKFIQKCTKTGWETFPTCSSRYLRVASAHKLEHWQARSTKHTETEIQENQSFVQPSAA